MKKLSLLLLMLLLAVAWIWAKGESETATSEEGDEPFIELTKVFYFGDSSDDPDLKEEFIDSFYDEFGVNLKVNALPRNNYMEKVNLMITSGELTGLVSLFTPGDVLKAIDDGTIEPLDEYLKDNATWKALPDYFKALFQYDGITYAIPNGWQGSAFARVIRKDWLETLNMNQPETIDQLTAVMKAFVQEDPDGNGKDDTYGMVSAGTWNLQDIFQTFDARLNNFGADPIVWDPNQDQWVDSMLKPEMLEALEYMSMIYRDGILDPEVFTNKGSTMREKFWSGKYGSTFYWLSWGLGAGTTELQKNIPDGEVGLIMGIKGNRQKNINHAVTGGSPWSLLSSTENPKKMVNDFVTTFYGDDRRFLWGAHGIEGKTFKLDAGTVVRLKDPDTENPYTTPGIFSRHPNWEEQDYPIITEGTEQEMEESLTLAKEHNEIIARAKQTGIVYECPGKFDVAISPTYTNIISDIRKIFEELIAKVTLGEITPQECVDTYRRQVKALGAQNILIEANEAVGLDHDAFYTY
ncbi:MAG: extracellular solute-binding protein [Spirochaetia bacterium]